MTTGHVYTNPESENTIEESSMTIQDEKTMSFQEACIPELAEGALKQAYYQTMAAGYKVVEAVNGQLVESSPDGSVRVLKSLPKATPVMPGKRFIRLKK